MGEEDAVAAAINLQRDAGVILSNLQILSQFVTSQSGDGSCGVPFTGGRGSVSNATGLRRHSTWPRWGCVVLRCVRAIPGLFRLHLVMCV